MADESKPKSTPVYVPYATLLSSFDALRTHGIPKSGVIDKSIWDSQSGTIQAQLILAYRFLGLIDDQKKISPSLQPLVSASSEDRKPTLKAIIEEKYHSVISLGLTTISPAQFVEAFRKFDISGSTLDRATRFFVKSCTELGIPIGKRFAERAKPTGPRKKRTFSGEKTPTGSAAANGIQTPPAGPQGTAKTIRLQSGGTLCLSATLDLFSLNSEDRKFIFGLIDSLEGYKQHEEIDMGVEA